MPRKKPRNAADWQSPIYDNSQWDPAAGQSQTVFDVIFRLAELAAAMVTGSVAAVVSFIRNPKRKSSELLSDDQGEPIEFDSQFAAAPDFYNWPMWRKLFFALVFAGVFVPLCLWLASEWLSLGN